MTDTFRLCQHNIGPTSYYNTRGKDNKMLFIDSDKSFRNIKNYMRNCEYQADIYTIQELQNGNQRESGYLSVDGINYEYEYNPTGKNDYYINNSQGISRNPKTIPHGCAVIYNTDKFNYVNTYTNFSTKELGKRASPWVLLEDKRTRQLYAVISLHGLIVSPLTKMKLGRMSDLYNSLFSQMDKIDLRHENIRFIIGTDLNINLFNPDLEINVRDSSQVSSREIKEVQKGIDGEMRYFRESLEDFEMNCELNNDIYTNYGGTQDNIFYDCIDFILKSKYLQTYEVSYGFNYIGTLPNYGDLEFLINDYDHTAIFSVVGN